MAGARQGCRGLARTWRTLRDTLVAETTAGCSTSVASSAQALRHATTRSFTAGTRQKQQVAVQWPELPTALTAIIGKQHLDASEAFVRNLIRTQKMPKWCNGRAWNEKSRTAMNRAYINVLSAFSCAPKGQTVMCGLPVLLSLGRQREASCYSAAGFANPKLRVSVDQNERLWREIRAYVDYLRERLGLTLRGLFLGFLFMPAIALTPVVLYLGVFKEQWAILVRKTLEVAGPAFIKWGQWASTRRDLFPPAFCREVSKLQVGVPSHKFYHTRRSVEKAFGEPFEDMFEVFDESPCASGSIAQVHKAKLSSRGAERINMKAGIPVAVKVCHPGVEDRLFQDFNILLGLADMASEYWDALFITESVNQFKGPIFEQLNLEKEAEHLNRFHKNFKRNRDVSFPKPLYPYVSSNVLVETFEDGHAFADMFEKEHPWNTRLAQMGLNCMFKMLLVDNFIHADLHPGNILITLKEPSMWARLKARFFGDENVMPRPHITLLDTGMAASLPHHDQNALVKFFEGVAKLDGGIVAESSLKMTKNGDSFPTRDVFIKDVHELFRVMNIHMDKYDDLPPANECMFSILDLFRKHSISVKPELSIVIATLFMLEGWATTLDPELRIMKTLKRISTENTISSDMERIFAA